ncbi:hypothetical protein [Weissella minor]|uniref:hypothetical protein n=1 Tax=Weissella minor TaxID=1620 RepID=UPI003AF27D47
MADELFMNQIKINGTSIVIMEQLLNLDVVQMLSQNKHFVAVKPVDTHKYVIRMMQGSIEQTLKFEIDLGHNHILYILEKDNQHYYIEFTVDSMNSEVSLLKQEFLTDNIRHYSFLQVCYLKRVFRRQLTSVKKIVEVRLKAVL